MIVLLIILAIVIFVLAIRFGLLGAILEIVFSIGSDSGGSSSNDDSFGGGDSGGGGSNDDW